jgi:hypothetical protein
MLEEGLEAAARIKCLSLDASCTHQSYILLSEDHAMCAAVHRVVRYTAPHASIIPTGPKHTF